MKIITAGDEHENIYHILDYSVERKLKLLQLIVAFGWERVVERRQPLRCWRYW